MKEWLIALLFCACIPWLGGCGPSMTNTEKQAQHAYCRGIDTSWCVTTMYPTDCEYEVFILCQEMRGLPWYNRSGVIRSTQ